MKKIIVALLSVLILAGCAGPFLKKQSTVTVRLTSNSAPARSLDTSWTTLSNAYGSVHNGSRYLLDMYASIPSGYKIVEYITPTKFQLVKSNFYLTDGATSPQKIEMQTYSVNDYTPYTGQNVGVLDFVTGMTLVSPAYAGSYAALVLNVSNLAVSTSGSIVPTAIEWTGMPAGPSMMPIVSATEMRLANFWSFMDLIPKLPGISGYSTDTQLVIFGDINAFARNMTRDYPYMLVLNEDDPGKFPLGITSDAGYDTTISINWDLGAAPPIGSTATGTGIIARYSNGDPTQDLFYFRPDFLDLLAYQVTKIAAP